MRQTIRYEAQAAIEMETLCELGDDLVAYAFKVTQHEAAEIDPQPVLQAVVHDLLTGIAAGQIAARFHAAVAEMTVRVCRSIREQHAINVVALSGGVFQNVHLLQMTVTRLRESGFEPLVHRIVPPNDGGLALGQAYIAAGAPQLSTLN